VKRRRIFLFARAFFCLLWRFRLYLPDIGEVFYDVSKIRTISRIIYRISYKFSDVAPRVYDFGKRM